MKMKMLSKAAKKNALTKALQDAVKATAEVDADAQLVQNAESSPAAAPAAPAAPEDAKGLTCGKQVLVWSEYAGQGLYGKVGVLKGVKGQTASIDLLPGVHALPLEFLCKASGDKHVDFKAVKKLQGMNVLTRAVKQQWLEKLDELHMEPPSPEGSWLLDWHMTAGMLYLEWSLWLKKAANSRT